MTTVTIELADEQAERLISLAQHMGMRLEDLARALLMDSLRRPDAESKAAFEYVLEKNKELYRRLA